MSTLAILFLVFAVALAYQFKGKVEATAEAGRQRRRAEWLMARMSQTGVDAAVELKTIAENAYAAAGRDPVKAVKALQAAGYELLFAKDLVDSVHVARG